MDIQTCLRLLELETPFTPARMHRAYRRMVRRWHPDQFAHEPSMHAVAEERLKAINAAYAKLKEHLAVRSDAGEDTNDGRNPFNWSPSARPKSTFRAAASETQYFAGKPQAGGNIRRDQMRFGAERAAGRPTAGPKRPLSQFMRILQEKDPGNFPKPTSGSPGRRQAYRHRPLRRRRHGLRVDGSTPVNPLQPIRPISSIDPIEGSD